MPHERAYYRVAEKLGWSVEQLLDHMDPDEYAGWVAHLNLCAEEQRAELDAAKNGGGATATGTPRPRGRAGARSMANRPPRRR